MVGESQKRDLFPETAWSVVIAAGSQDSQCAVEALGRLCEVYRHPIFAWLRAAGHGHHQAEDAVQDLIHHLLNRQRLKPLSPRDGRFRSYLITCLRNLLNDQRDARRAAKRGGDADIQSAAQVEVATEAGPCEQALDREFAVVVRQRAMAAVRTAWGKRERLPQFNALEQFVLSTPEPGIYAEVGPRVGLSAAQVKRMVFDLREQFLDAFRVEVARTVTPEELEGELKHLLSILHQSS